MKKSLKSLVEDRLKRLGISQRELAARAGVNPTYINEILSGKKKSIQTRFVPALAFALEVDPKDLTVGSTRPSQPKLKVADRRTIIRSNSPQVAPRFSLDLRPFRVEPTFDPDRHVPLFVEPFPHDFPARVRLEDVPRFLPLVWPEYLGLSHGCYAMLADCVGASALLPHSFYLVAPARRIESGTLFLGEFRYMEFHADYCVRAMIDATEDNFVLRNPDGLLETVPRGALRRLHRIVGLLESQD